MTIESLSDDTLLEIFDFYRVDAVALSRGRPWKWHRLAHVCRRWRSIVDTSPRRLGLQILCKNGARVERILSTWPTLPLVLRFKGNAKSKSLPNNVMIALRHPDRVCEVDVCVTSSIIGSIAELLQVPFMALKNIRMESKDAKEPPALGDFLGGSAPLLNEIHLHGIAVPFPAIRRLVLSTSHLNMLSLAKIPNTCYFSPEDLVTCLSALVHLTRLFVDFHSPASRPNSRMAHLPSPERAILPSLVNLAFYGANEYLEGFFARIDCPALTSLLIKYFNQLIFEIPQLVQFISRVDALKSPTEVTVKPDVKYSGMSLRRRTRGGGLGGECYVMLPCSQFDWQLSFSTQILHEISALLCSVRVLSIDRSYFPLIGKEDMEMTQWLELFQPLSQISKIHVSIEELVPDIMHSLVSEDTAPGILPRLTSLHLEGYRKSTFAMEAAARFVAARKLAGHNIRLSG